MRALLCCLLVAACGPKVAPKGNPFDEDLDTRHAEVAPVAVEAPRPEAPPGKGLRSGTIERAKLIAVLDGGPGAFLRSLEVTPRMDGERFVGWQLVQLLDRQGPLVDVDVVPGDVLLAVNGRTISRPDQLQSVWDSLRTANELRAQLWRGEAKLELTFAIEPQIDPTTMRPPAAANSPGMRPPAAKPEPAKPEPAKSEPTKSEPAKPEPAKPEPAKSEPAKAPPVQLKK